MMKFNSSPAYKIIDIFVFVLVSGVSYWIRFDTLTLPFGYALLTMVQTLFMHLALHATNFYRDSSSKLTAEIVASCFAGFLLCLFTIATLLYITKTGEVFSRQWIITNCILAFAAFLLYRSILSLLTRSSESPKKVIIIGTSPTIQNAKHAKDISESLGVSLDQHFTTDECLASIANYIEKRRKSGDGPNHAISEIWLTSEVFEKYDTEQIEDRFSDSATTIVFLPTLPSTLSLSLDDISVTGGLLTINSSVSKRYRWNSLIKLVQDKLISFCGIIILMPFLSLIALAIKIDSKGPVFFKQTRYGIDGKEFKMWKFRTMHTVETDTEFAQAKVDDPRITRIGGFLRRWSLDELPQLINVLSGEMSIVGPRPHPVSLNEEYRKIVPNYMKRHTIKPGITGLAQIRGHRGELRQDHDMQDRIKHDLFYIKNWSVWLDIKIIIGTFLHVITTDQAY